MIFPMVARVALFCSLGAAVTLAAPAPYERPSDPAFPGQYGPKGPPLWYPAAPKRCLQVLDKAERCQCLEWLSGDWASLRRHAFANARLAPRKPSETRVVFFGDSITDNWARPTFGGFFPGRPYLNRGIGGQTTAQMLARFSDDVLAPRPQVLVILAGTNDISGNSGVMSQETSEQNLSSMAELARAHGIRVVLSSLLPVRDTDGSLATSSERPRARIEGLNRWIAAYARLNGFVYLDYHTALVDTSGQLGVWFTTDGVHPTAEGYAVMAPLAERAIAQSMRLPVGPPKASRPVPRAEAPVAEPAYTTGPHAPADGRSRFPGSTKDCGHLSSGEDRCACLTWGLKNHADLSRYAEANRQMPPVDSAMTR